MRNTVKKITAFLLMMVMVMNGLPFSVLAESPSGESNTVQLRSNPSRTVPGIDLTDIASVAVQSVASSGSTTGSGNVERHDKINIKFSFNIDNNKLQTAKDNQPWRYNISQYVGDNAVFQNLIVNESGTLYDGDYPAGTYSVSADGTVELRPDAIWLGKHTSGIAGSFQVSAQLNETVTQNLENYMFDFPGGAKSTITFTRKTIEADKYAYLYKGAAELAHAYAYDLSATENKPTDSESGGEVEVIDAGDGSYRLFYKIRVQINCKPNGTYTITDTLGGGQELIPSTFEVYIPITESSEENIPVSSGGTSFLTVNADGAGFTLNLKSALEAKYGADISRYIGQDVWLEYYTRLEKEDLVNVQINTASVQYDSKTVTPSVSITPTHTDSLSSYKWISNDPEINTHVEDKEGIDEEMTVGTDGKVYFLTGGKLSYPATSLYVSDVSEGITVDQNSFRLSVGTENEGYLGYEWYRGDLTASNALTVDETTGAFTFDAYRFIKYLVQVKQTYSADKTYAEYYENLFYYADPADPDSFTLRPGTVFKLCYAATAQEDYLPGAADQLNVSNTATWTSSYMNEPASIDVKLLPDPGTPTLTKNGYGLDSGEAVNKPDGSAARNVPAGTRVRYELTAAKKTSDGVNLNIAGYTVVDRINNYISAIPETIEIYNSAGQRIALYNTERKIWAEGADLGLSIQVVNDGSEGGWTAAIGIAEGIGAPGYPGVTLATQSLGEEYDLFRLTFPEDGNFADEYTIKYTVELDKEMPAGDGIYGVQHVENSGGIGIGVPTPDVSITTNIDYGFPYGSNKEFVEWDKEHNEAVWAVNVRLGDLTEIIRPVRIIEYYYSAHTWATAGDTHKVAANSYSFEAYELLDGNVQGAKLNMAASETGAAMNEYIIVDKSDDEDYPLRELVFPKGINKNVRVIIRMKLPDDLSKQLEYHAHNAAYVKINANDMPVTADADYYDNDFDFTKKGAFSAATEQGNNGKAKIRWTIELNSIGKKLKNNFKPVFRDILPDGLEMDGKISITGYLGNSTHEAFIVELETSQSTGDLGKMNIIDLISNNWDNTSVTTRYNPYAYDKPTGLSGWHFEITFTTELTAKKLQDIDAIWKSEQLINIPFTNTAEIYDEGDTLLKQASDTVQYEYENLISKQDVSSTDGAGNVSTLEYEIVINKEAKPINGGLPLTLHDTIPENMSLTIGQITVELVGKTGDEAKNYTVSYDASRLLEITVPDATKAVIRFKAKPDDGCTTFVNSAMLFGSRFSQTDTAERTYSGNSSGSITGMSYSVKIHKIDKYQPTTNLSGAKFEFYRYQVGEDGKILSEETIKHSEGVQELDYYTTADDDGIITFTEIAPNTLYGWKETEAPAEYIIASNVPCYFVVYQVLEDTNSVTIPWNKLSQETRDAIVQYRNYDPTQGTGNTGTEPWVYVKASGPAPGQENEYNNNHYCWLSNTEYQYPASQTGYESLLDEVNTVNKAEADALAGQVNSYYDGQKTAVSVKAGYTWNVENIKNNATVINLSVSKKMIGRDMIADEFTFFLYDDTASGHSRLLQTISSPAGTNGATVSIDFAPVSIPAPGTYKYRIYEKTGNADKVTYDTAVYLITVEAKRDADNELKAQITGITKTKDNVETDVTTSGLPVPFVNTYGTVELTGTKIWVDNKESHNNRTEITLTLYQQSAAAGAAEATFAVNELPAGASFAWGTGENKNDYTFSNLPQYDAEGYAYTYWVTESQVNGYAAPVYTNIGDKQDKTDGAYNNGTITNTSVIPDKGRLKVKKTIQVNGTTPTPENKSLILGTYTFNVYTTENGVKTDTLADTLVITFDENDTAFEKTCLSKELEAGTYWIEENPATLISGTNGRTVVVTAGKKLESEIEESGTAAFINNNDTGSLKITKQVKYNGQAVTDNRMDGDYTFTITSGKGVVPATTRTVVIHITDGAPASATIDGAATTLDNGYVTVSGLPVGAYTVTEKVPNGQNLTGTNDRKMTVTGGENATIPTEIFENTKEEFGSLKILKTVDTVGTVDTKKEFSFTVQLTAPAGGVLNDSYPAVKMILNSEGNLVEDTETTAVTLENGIVVPDIVLHAGESLQIKKLPAGTTYTVTETMVGSKPIGTGKTIDGYTNAKLVHKGTVTTEGAEEEFINGYTAKGKAVVEVGKHLEGRNLKIGEDAEFTFTVGSTTMNGVTSPLVDETFTGIEADKLTVLNGADSNLVKFPELWYDLSEQGKTYVYVIKENDFTAENVTRNTSTGPMMIYAQVVVGTDNYDGTMSDATVTYYKDSACQIPLANNAPIFVNTYHASTEIDLEAIKEMVTRDLVGDDFAFTLTGDNVNQRKTNDSDGLVKFDPIYFAMYPTADQADYIDLTNELGSGEYVLTLTLAEDTTILTDDIVPVEPTSIEVNVTVKYDWDTGVMEAEADLTKAEMKFINTSVSVLKVDFTNPTINLPGAKFAVYNGDELISTFESASDKAVEVKKLKSGVVYTLRETEAPHGYLKLEKDIQFKVNDQGVVELVGNYSNVAEVLENNVIRIKDEMKKVSIAVHKVWDDDNDRDGVRPIISINVKLLRDGAEYKTVKLEASNNWTAMVQNLDSVYVKDGKIYEYTYTWSEPAVQYYTLDKAHTTIIPVTLSSMEGNEGTLSILTNKRTPDTTEIEVEKIWVDKDNAAKKRTPSITVELYADGEAIDRITLDASNNWKYTWKDLPKCTNPTGQKSEDIKYTVAELDIPEGYEVKIDKTSKGYKITNTLQEGSLIIEKQFDIQTPEEVPEEEEMKTEIEVVKIWDDHEDRDGNRPESITVHLFAGGEEVKTATLNAQNGWKKKWGDLPKFVDGHPIHYSVTEDPVQWYVPEIHGFTITNHYNPETTSISVRKVWNDAGFEMIRPKDILVKLNNGMCVILNEENGWFGTIAGLPTYVNGEPAVYTWSEPEVMGYTLESMVTEGNVTVITNKVWQREEEPKMGKTPKVPGNDLTLIDEYDTPLGVEVIINHVGDCFD